MSYCRFSSFNIYHYKFLRYVSLAEVEQKARNKAADERDLLHCRLCGTYCSIHYWQCDLGDGSSEPDSIPEKVY